MTESLCFTIDEDLDNQRLDIAIAQLLPNYSRSRLQSLIKAGDILLNNAVTIPKQRVYLGDTITGQITEQNECEHTAQPIALNIVYQDDSIIVIDKPAGLIVHPGAGNPDKTLLNGILYHFPQCQHVPRAGIVHRLDKDTSGLMVVAKTVEAQFNLVQQLQARTVKRHYYALVTGHFTGPGTVDAPIGRSHNDRLRMAVTPNGKPAMTHYHILSLFNGLSLIECRLETGRTHQIRVHMAHIHHPLVGDTLYNGRHRIPKGLDATTRAHILNFPRQALHAKTLAFHHPDSGEIMQFESEMPEDIKTLLEQLSSS